MSSVNKVILVGRVGNDPDIKELDSQKKIANFSVATSERWIDKTTKEKREKTEWHRIAIFNDGLVSLAENYIKKGTQLYIEGALQTRKWQDKQGNDVYTTEIVLKSFNSKIVLLGNSTASALGNNESAKSDPQEPIDLEDDIPF